MKLEKVLMSRQRRKESKENPTVKLGSGSPVHLELGISSRRKNHGENTLQQNCVWVVALSSNVTKTSNMCHS